LLNGSAIRLGGHVAKRDRIKVRVMKQYRKKFRAWLNFRRLERERAAYDFLFASRGLILPDDDALRAAMKRKYPYLIPGRKGALHILALYHHYNWENESLKPALEKFGTVRHYDWCDEFDHQRKDWRGTPRKEMNRTLVERVERWIKEDSTDVIFTYISGEQVSPDTIASLSTVGVPTINLALNDKEHFVGRRRNGQAMGSRDICRYFDLCWTSTEDALKKYCVEGALPIYLPEGANPEIHKPHDLEKTMDVSFVGQCYGNRPGIIQKLLSEGIQVEAYGYGWPKGALSTEEMVRMYSRSRINLGFGGVADHRATYNLKGRDFEIPMSGGLYLTEYNPELERFYEIGNEIVTWIDFGDLVQKIRHLLSHPEEAEAIRKKGFQRARAEHTWEMRFEKIFKLIGLI